MPIGSSDSSDSHVQLEVAPRILAVDDDAEMRALLLEVLTEEGYEVQQATNAAEALIRLRNENFSAIVLDKNMPGLSGLDILPGLRLICPQTPVIMITAYGDVATYMDAVEKGVSEYLFKPFRMEELLGVLRRTLALDRSNDTSTASPAASA